MNADLHALAGAYVLDALDDAERVEFEAHLATCPDCATEVAEFRGVAAELADSASTVPPTHLKAAIMSQLAGVPQELPAPPSSSPPAPDLPVPAPVDLAERRRRKFSFPNMIAAAAVVALIAVGAVLIAGNLGGSEFDDVVAADDAVATQLDGASGSIEVVYSIEQDRVAVRGTDLDDLAPGLRYALWAIADGIPVPAGLFEPGGGEVEFVTELGDVSPEAWGVTVEPETGSDQPTTEIILFAEV